MIFSCLVFGQESQNTKKPQIVSVNIEDFYVEEAGIPEFIKIQKQLEIEFKDRNKELKDLVSKLKELTDEIEKVIDSKNLLGCDYRFEKKIDIAKKMDSEIVQKRNELSKSYLQRQDELSKTANEKVLKAMKEFCKEKGYDSIIDYSQYKTLCEGNLGCFCQTPPDVTKEFIQFYNEQFGNEKSQ